MKFVNPSFLKYTAMADAYGMAVEFLDPDLYEAAFMAALSFSGYQKHPLSWAPPPSLYTDDTEMSIANSNVLLSCKEKYTKLDFANAYVDEFIYGGKRKGYSRGFQAVLENVSNGTELLATLKPTSNKNGAAMRSVPFGVMSNIGNMLDVATLSASVTHDTAEGLFSARAIALAGHYSFHVNQALEHINDFICDNLPLEDKPFLEYVQKSWPENMRVKDYSDKPISLTTVHAVLTLISKEKTLMGMLAKSIKMGGDTDSVASLCWGLASSRLLDEAIPEFLLSDLESGDLNKIKRLDTIGKLLMVAYKK